MKRADRLSGAAWDRPLVLGVALALGITSARGDVTYQDTIRPLFQASCLNCHNPDKNKAGLDLSTYDATMDGSDNGKVVTAGDADASVLYKVLTHAAEPYMPKNGDKLPDSQIEVIREWIQSNAPEKTGGMVARQAAGPAVTLAPSEEKPKGPPAMPRDGSLEPVLHTPRPGAVPGVAGSPWAPLVALAGQKQVLLYNTDTLDLAAVLPFPEGFPAVVTFSRNGSLLIAGGGVGAKLGHVVIWDVITGKRLIEVGDEFDTVLAADISPDQSLVALGGPSRLVKIFSASDGKMLCKMKKHTDWVTALCFTPDGKALLSGDRAGGLAVWDTQGHELQSTTAHEAAITGIACRGNLVATCSEDGTVKFWDIVEGKQTKSWKAHDGGVRSIAFTSDGQIVTSGRDRFVRLWDATGRQIRQFGPLTDIAMQAGFAGGKIIASDWTGLVRVWTPDGKRVGDLDSNPPTIAQRLDQAVETIAAAESRQARERQAVNDAGTALAAAQKKATDDTATLAAARAALAAAQARLDASYKDWARNATRLQMAEAEVSRIEDQAQAMALNAGPNPALESVVVSAFASKGAALDALRAQSSILAKATAALGASRDRAATLTRLVEAMGRISKMSQSKAKAATVSLDQAQSEADRTTASIKAANADLAKWRAIANHLNATTQLALRKTDAK
jgi:WD40 repeat protein